MSKHIILGSGSPRRKELLAGLDVEFEVDTKNNFVEFFNSEIIPEDIPVKMSEGKSHGFHRELGNDEILITADTVVIVKDGDNARVLGKPHTRDEAVGMLEMLSGRTHTVVTAVTIRDKDKEKTFRDFTDVTFTDISSSEIDFYIDRYKPFDKAGSYGVQEWIGYVAISGINGSFYNVMGFPVHRVYQELQAFL